jgi:hypothetical protein
MGRLPLPGPARLAARDKGERLVHVGGGAQMVKQMNTVRPVRAPHLQDADLGARVTVGAASPSTV